MPFIRLRSTLPFVVLCSLFAGCSGPPPPPKPDEPKQEPTAPAPTQITITAPTTRVDHHGGTTQLTAAVVDQNGAPVSSAIGWTSSDTSIVQVDANGVVSGRQPGQARVLATSGSLFAETTITVELQPNSKCTVPTTFPTKGPVGPLPTFTSASGYFNVTPPRFDMAIPANGDFDGDGDEDVIIFTSNFPPNPDDGAVLFWRNTGSGYEDATTAVLGAELLRASHTRQLEVRDLNGDEVVDVFAVQHGYDNAGVGAPSFLLLSQPGGTMKELAPTNLDPYETGIYSHASAAGDIDCDGDVDLFAGSGGGTVHRQWNHLFVNSGVGAFKAEDQRLPPDAADPYLGGQVTSSLMCDLDRDGDEDLILGGSHKNPSAFLLNDGFGNFRHAKEPRLPVTKWDEAGSVVGNVVDARCSDVNLDGWQDLLLSVTYDSSYSPARVELWINEGDLAFRQATEEWIPNERTDGWVWTISLRDFNGDVWPDFQLKYSGAGGASPVYVNKGGTGFTVVDPGGTYVVPVDADGDGRTDLFWPGGVSPGGDEYPPILHWNNL